MKFKHARYLFKITWIILLIPFVPLRVTNQYTSSHSQTFVAFTIDDANPSWINTVDPIFKKYNLSITGFITDVERANRGITWDKIELLQETGRWEFGWHGTDHFLLTRLTGKEEKEQITGFNGFFKNHSLPRPKTFCYPFGGYDFTTIISVSEYFSASRTVDEGVNTVYWVQDHPMEIKVIRIFSERNNDYYKNVVSENLGNGVFIVFYLHAVGEPINKGLPIEISPEDFDELIEWLVGQDVKIVSFSRGIEKMKSRDYKKKSIIKFDNPLQTHITSRIPMPSRYWETTLLLANFFGRYVPPVGDWMLKYWTSITTFIVLSLVFFLGNCILLIRRSDRS